MKHTLTTLIPTLLIVFACSASTQAQRFLSYEPEEVELDGRLVVQTKHGPPNFGEQPKTDQKVSVPVLLLSQSVVVQSDPGGKDHSPTAYNVTQVQLAFAGGETSHKKLIGKPVVVTGRLFRAHTGHHYTEVVLNVQSIESKPAGYDQRQFDVCRINTSEWYVKERRGSSSFLHAEFRAPIGDDEVVRSFKHAKSGLIINAGVQYLYDTDSEPPKPREIRIAISAGNKEEHALDMALDNAVAGTNYGRNWGSLYVTKQVAVGDIEYTFTLYCFDRNATWYKRFAAIKNRGLR